MAKKIAFFFKISRLVWTDDYKTLAGSVHKDQSSLVAYEEASIQRSRPAENVHACNINISKSGLSVPDCLLFSFQLDVYNLYLYTFKIVYQKNEPNFDILFNC